MRIYNRALSLTEIQEHYRNIAIGIPTVNPVTSPVNTPTIILSGTKPANTSVVVTNGSTGTEIAPQSDAEAWAATTWQSTITLKSGMNNLSITAKDVDGYHSQPTSLSVALDDTAPTVASSDPVNSGIFKTPVSTITFNLQDAFSPLDLSATIAHATVKSNSGLDVLGTWTTSGSGSSGSALFTAASPMGEGTYTATITPTDSFSNQSTANVNFTVDMTAPVPPTIDPITVPINTTARAITGAKSGDSVQVKVTCPGSVVGAVSYSSATTWSVAISGLKEGTNTVTAYAQDAAGNQSGLVSMTFTVDLTPPAKPSVDAPASPTNNTSVILTGTKEAGSFLYVNNVKTPAAFGDTAWSHAVNLSEGSNSFTVYAKDEASNQSQSASVSIFRDTTAPVISASTPTSNGVIGSADSISITLADVAGGAGVDLQASLAGAVVKDPAGAVISGTWSVSGSAIIFTPVAQLAEGKYTVTIYPVDNLGNKGSAAFSFTLDRAPPSAAALALSPVSPVKAGTVTFTITFSEAMDSAVQPTVTFGTIPYAITGAWQGDKKSWKGTYAFTASIGDGAYTVTVKGAKDLAGNTMADQTAGNFTLDTTAPAAPTAAAVTTPTKITTQTITGTKPADTAIVINGTVRVPINSATAWSYNYPLTEGANTLSITARDVAGNDSAAISPAPVITLDTTPPVFTVDVIKNPSPTVTQTISGKKEAGAIVTLNGTTIFDATDQNATWSYDLTLIDGITNHLVFTAADALGNTTTKTLDVLCDISPPQALAAGMLVADGSGKGTEVTLSWPSYMEPADLAYYRIYSANADFSTVTSLTPLGTVNKGTKTYKAGSLTKGSTYYFAAVPVSASGNADSTVHTAQGVPADTAAPEDVTALSSWTGYTATDGNYATFSWTASKDSIGDLSDQTVYLDAGQGYDSGTAIGKTVLTYTKKGLADATAHKFKVTVKDNSGQESSGTVTTAVTRLANPTGLSATPGSGKITLSWNAVNSPYVKLYNIYRLKSGDQQADVSAMTLIKSQTGTSFTDTGLDNGTTYQYAVTTLNTSGSEKTTVQSISALPRSDTTGPVIVGANIISSQIITAPLAISASATDAESTIDRIELRIDDVLVKTATGSSLSWSWNIVTSATDGNHTIKLTAYDGPGNLTEQTIPVVVSLALPAIPAITGHNVTATTPAYLVTVNGTSSPDTAVTLKLNGVAAGQPVQTSSGAFSFAGIQLKEGDNILNVKASHRGGDSSYCADYRITVDTGAPTTPVNLTVKAQSGGSLQFNWQTGTGETPSGFNLYEANAAFTTKTDSGVKKTNTTPITYLLREYIPTDDTPHFYAVTALDGAGNESPISNVVQITSDRTLPMVTAISFTDANGNTPADNIYGPGVVKVAFTVTEPLSEVPFLSLEGQSGSPIVVAANKLDDSHYSGSFTLDATSPQGTAVYKFSGKDLTGNRSNSQGTGITIDVKGPVADITAPLTLLKTTAGPVAVSFTLDEPSTATPSLTLKASDGGTAQATGLTSTDNGLHWSGSIDPSALAEGKGQFVLGNAKDRFGNIGSTIKTGVYIGLYKNTPPAPSVPFGLAAKPAKGGAILLSWAKVTDAQGYNVYRQGTGDTAPVLVASISTGATVTYTDTPLADGSYSYSVTSTGLLGSESERSDPATAVSDRTPPAQPTGLSLAISGNGIKATWDAITAPAEVPYAYRLYRSDGVITDITWLTPLVTVKNSPATDPSPTKAKRFYAITSLDSLGNESSPVSAPEITFPVAPVANLVLSVIDDGKPSLSWNSGEANLQGFYIYRNGARINQTPTSSTTYSDGYYSGGTVGYGVSAIDSVGNESPIREVTLPLLTIGLKDGTVLHRGFLEKVALTASIPNDATANLAIDAVNVKIGTLPESTEAGPFTVVPGTPLEIDKVAASEANAPPQEAVVVTAVMNPSPGTTIKMSKSSLASVIGSGTALEIFNDPLVRGTQASVRIKVNNLGTARTEFLTSENGGATSHVKITLKDQDGNVLAQGNLNQRTGSVVNSGSYATARIEPGESFLSEPITFVIPSSAPFKVVLDAAIDNTWYHYGLDDQVTAPGLKQDLETTIADVSYMANAQTDKTVYRQGEPVVISGVAVSTANSQPMPLVPVKIGVSVNGFDRFFTVNTDQNGIFSYTFIPGINEAGSYSVWAIHPDLSDRSAQSRFSITGMSVSPTLANIKILKGQSYDIPVSLKNLGGNDLTALSFNTSASGGITAGVVNTGDNKLTAGENQAITLRVTASSTAPDTGYATLDISTAEGLGDRVTVNLNLVTAIPIINTSPSLIDTGIVRATQRVASFTITNTGMDTLKNVRIEGPSTSWLSLTLDKNIGDIPVNQSKTVGILINPDANVPQGVYNDRLVIYSDNHIPYNYNIQVTVTSNSVGSVLFYILDELNQKVPNATITLQNQSVTELIYTLKTGTNGTDPSITDIPEGRYSYSISAPNHKSMSGSFVVIPGVWVTVPALMEYNLVNIEWSVTPVVIEDRYEIKITQTYVTDVPAPVLVSEPPSVNLPEMAPGQVYNGEFKIANYGLVALNNVKIDFPKSFGDYDIEVMASVPETLNAMQKITVPYRVTKRQSAAAALELNRENMFASVAEEVKSFGGSCFSTFPIGASGNYVPCPTIPQSVDKSTAHTVSVHVSCSGGSSTGTGGGGPHPIPVYGGGGPGIGSGQSGGGGWMPGAVPSLIGDGDECGDDIPRCNDGQRHCPTTCTNSLVNMGSGTYEDSQVDIDIKTNGIPVAFERHYVSRWSNIGKMPSGFSTENYFSQAILVSNGGGGCGGGGSSSNRSKFSCGGVMINPSPRPDYQPPQKFGWTSPWFAKINDFGSHIAYFDGAGQIIHFYEAADGSYVPGTGAEEYAASLRLQALKTADGFRIVDKTGLQKNFNLIKSNGWYVLSSIEDTHGSRLTFGYDDSENLISVDDATGVRVATLSYVNNYLNKIIDRNGREVIFSVDSKGRLSEVTGPQGEKSNYVYDQVNGFNRLLMKTDPEGLATIIEYLPGQLVVSKVTEPGGAVRSFAYDFKGYTFYSTDTRGNVTINKVNTKGKLTSVTRNGRIMKKVDYPTEHSEVITDEAGNATRITTNEHNDPIRITDGEGNETRIEYNQFWKVSKVTDPLGNVTTFDYNTARDLIAVTDPLGQKTLLDYDQFGNLIKVTKGSSVTVLENDDRGNLTKVTDPLGNITILGYDQYGHVNKVTDARGNTTNITNDLLGNPLTVENPLGSKKKYIYDKKGHVTSVTDELNRTVSYTYDFKGRVTSATDPLGKKTALVYDGEGNLVQKKELEGTADERLTSFTYDIFNRLETSTDPLNNLTRYDYTGSPGCPTCSGGSASVPTKITDPLGNVTEYSFNKAGKLMLAKDPLSYLTNLARDAGGKVTSVRDANGNLTQYQYDVLWRVVRQTDANGGLTSFTYDDQGNLATLTDPNGNTTKFDYDLAGRKIKETRPMGQVTEYTYYPNGLVKTVKDAKGHVTTYTYDAANRLTERAYADGRKNTFGYDSAGNLTSYAKDGVAGTITYDELGRKLSETVNYGPFSKTYGYSYDASGNKASFTSPEGKVYNYTYNKNNQPIGINFDGKTIQLDYQWDRLTKTQLPNGVSTDYQYNANSWLSYINTRNATSTLASSQYGFDNVGNITSKTTEQGNHAYGFDPTYQLTSATSPVLPAENFTYDKTGNRLTSSTGSGSKNYTSNANNELSAVDGVSYTYDANGNTTSKTANGQTTTYIYSSTDRLETVQLPDGRIATYTYDPFGRRIKKQVGSETTYFLYGDEGLIGEYDSAGNLKKGYGWQPDGIWGTSPVFMTENGKYYFYQNDHLGTPQKMTDENGNVVWSATYISFGQAIVDPASTVTNNLRFPGQYFDEETGLHYNWNRYYDPETGRYTQVDPVGFGAGDGNLYKYVGNNPRNMFDPYGLWDVDWREVGKGAAKAAAVIGVAAVVIIALPVEIPAGVVTGLAVVGAAVLGWDTGQLITGKKVSVGPNGVSTCKMSDKQRSEMLGEAAVGWATMGLAGIKGAKGPKVEPINEGQACFTGNTPILTEDGQKPIKDIKKGDLVYSEDISTGKKGLKNVNRTFIHDRNTVLVLSVSETKIETTHEHPFWVVGKGWVEAGKLKAGDVLLLFSGKQVHVSSVDTKILAKAIKVYNFEVEDWHTYFVSSEHVLVHNKAAKITSDMLSQSETIAKGRNIRKIDELVEKFGGKAKDWVKKKGWDDAGNEWHWYENKGRREGLKPAGEPDPF